MLRLRFPGIVGALAIVCVMAGCGVKGPLVPAKKGTETAAPPPPPATTAPEIPSATLPANPTPPP